MHDHRRRPVARARRGRASRGNQGPRLERREDGAGRDRAAVREVERAQADAVASGEAELGFTQISEILPVAGAELAGPLPPGIQIYTVFPAAVGAGAKDPGAAQAFIKALTAPAAAPVVRAKGMEPG